MAFFPAATLTKARSSVPSGRVEKIRLRIHVCGLTEALAAASRTPTTRRTTGVSHSGVDAGAAANHTMDRSPSPSSRGTVQTT